MSAAPMPEASDRDLSIARRLAEVGVPLFVARPDPGSSTGFQLPSRWQLTVPKPSVVDTWQPGDALCAVMGVRIDLLDVDPRNGGAETVAALQAAGMWPRSYGSARTPSGGTHDFVAPMGTGSRDNVRPGFDVKGGRTGLIEQAGRGFAFIAPTVRASKVTGELVAYQWAVEPDFEAIEEGLELDDAGRSLADVVREAIGHRAATSSHSAGGTLDRTADAVHSGPIPVGDRHRALVSYAGRLRDRGLSYDEALALWRLRWADCEQPADGYYYSEEEARRNTLDDLFARYPAPPVDIVTATFGDLPAVGAVSNVTPLRPEYAEHVDEAEETDRALEAELAFNRAVAEEVARLRIRDASRRAFQREQQAETPRPEFVGLGDFLAVEDSDATHRITGLWPTGGRVLLAAAFKAGKSTVVGNVVRSLVDGDLFLGEFPTDPVSRRVLMLDNELDERNLRRWLRDQGIRAADKVTVVPMRGKVGTFDLLDPVVRSQWAAQIAEAEADVVIFDCLRPVLDALGLSEDKDAGRFLVQFDALLAEAGVAEAIVVHHAGHDGERSRGDSRLRDWPDAEWRITRLRDGDGPIDPAAPRFFAAYGRDVDVPEGRLDYDTATRRLTYVEGNRKDAKGTAVAQRWSALAVSLVGEPPLQGPKGQLPGWTLNALWTAVKDFEAGSRPSRRDLEATLDDLVSKRLLLLLDGPSNGRYYALASAPGGGSPGFASGSPASREGGFPGSPPLYEGGEPGNPPLSTRGGSAREVEVVSGLVRFTTPDACPCGRPVNHHGAGQWVTCPRCEIAWHGLGMGKLPACPTCPGGRT